MRSCFSIRALPKVVLPATFWVVVCLGIFAVVLFSLSLLAAGQHIVYHLHDDCRQGMN